jgi:hypothetical protein
MQNRIRCFQLYILSLQIRNILLLCKRKLRYEVDNLNFLMFFNKKSSSISMRQKKEKTIYNDLQMELRSPNNPAKRAER